MDLNNLNDLSQMRGMFNVNEMVGTDMDIFPNIFGNKMHMYTSDVCCKIQECAKMLEKYVDRFPATRGCVKFTGEDMRLWMHDYYRNLVHGGPQLPDDKYYTGNDRESNLGIGNDGEFSGEELFQFLYRLFQAITLHKIQSMDMMKIMNCSEMLSCAEMLEKYVSEYQKTRKNMKLVSEDMSLWKQMYYPRLVLSGPRLLDDKFFGSNNTNLGIGADGEFSGYELFQFLYRLYKEISNRL